MFKVNISCETVNTQMAKMEGCVIALCGDSTAENVHGTFSSLMFKMCDSKGTHMERCRAIMTTKQLELAYCVPLSAKKTAPFKIQYFLYMNCPRFNKIGVIEEQQLRSSYWNALELAQQRGCNTIVLPIEVGDESNKKTVCRVVLQTIFRILIKYRHSKIKNFRLVGDCKSTCEYIAHLFDKKPTCFESKHAKQFLELLEKKGTRMLPFEVPFFSKLPVWTRLFSSTENLQTLARLKKIEAISNGFPMIREKFLDSFYEHQPLHIRHLGGAQQFVKITEELLDTHGPLVNWDGYRPLTHIEDDDFHNVTTINEKIGENAIFLMLWQIVFNFNSRLPGGNADENAVGLYHPSLIELISEARQPEEVAEIIAEQGAFTIARKPRFLIPILHDNHFVLLHICVVMDENLPDYETAYVHFFNSKDPKEDEDSCEACTLEQDMFFVNEISIVVNEIIGKKIEKLDISTLERHQVYRQLNESNDGGLCTILNAELCLEQIQFPFDIRDYSPPTRTAAEVHNSRPEFTRRLEMAVHNGFVDDQHQSTPVRSAKIRRSHSNSGNAAKRSKQNPVVSSDDDDDEDVSVQRSVENNITATESNDSTYDSVVEFTTPSSRRSSDIGTPGRAAALEKRRRKRNSNELRRKKVRGNRNAKSATPSSNRTVNTKKVKGITRVEIQNNKRKYLLRFSKPINLIKKKTQKDPAASKKDQLLRNVAGMCSFAIDQLDKIRSHIKDQLTYPIGGPKNMAPEEIDCRRLCRIPMHIQTKKNQDNGKEFHQIEDVYFPIWREFQGIIDLTKLAADVQAKNGSEETGRPPQLPTQELERITLEASRLSPAPIIHPIAAIDDLEEAYEDVAGGPLAMCKTADDQLGTAVLKRVTKARKCDNDCPERNIGEAAAVSRSIYQQQSVSEGHACELGLRYLQYEHEGETRCVKTWLQKFAECYQGVRSILRRYQEIDKLLKLIVDCTIAEKYKDQHLAKKIMQLQGLPERLRFEYVACYAPRVDRSQHKEDVVVKKYEAVFRRWHNSLANLETESCEICKRQVQRTNTRNTSFADVQRVLDGDNSLDRKDSYVSCRTCHKSLRDGKIPYGAYKNNFKPDECPEEISCLNVVERMLIARARSNMKIVHLRNIGNRKTKMKGTNGVLVVLPTDIDGTVEHIENVLPSAAGVVLSVRTPWEKRYLVSMPKVIAALQWLKRNNTLYDDIQINPNFNFQLDEHVVYEREGATQDDANRLILRDDGDRRNTIDSRHLLTQEYVDEMPVIDMDEARDEMTAYDKFVLKRNDYQPLSISYRNIDALIYPWLHPRGTDGFDGKRTNSKNSSYLWVRLLNSVHSQWRKDMNWLCFMYGRKKQLDICAVQGVQARISQGATYNTMDFDDERNQKLITSAYSKSRGTPMYWRSVKYCLRSHVASFGSPVWFLTLNPDLEGWTDLHELYVKTNDGKPVDGSNVLDLIAKDPVIFARYFRHRVNTFFREVLLKKDGPLGEVTHWFRRYEYQHRGTQHVHCLLWTNTPPPLSASDNEVTSYLNRYVTARLPGKDEQQLRSLVEKHQTHWEKHSATCKRVCRIKGRCITTRCRFGFPRPKLKDAIFYRQRPVQYIKGASTNRAYYLARKKKEKFVNDYNPAVLLSWKANIDLQMVSSTRDVMNYVTCYVTKGETAKQKKDATEIWTSGMSRSKILGNYGIQMMQNREAGMLEIVDDLLGLEMYAFDMAHVFIPNDPINKRVRMLKAKSDRPNPDDLIYLFNMLDTYYKNRDPQFSHCSLFNIYANFEITTDSKTATTRRNRPRKDVQESDDDDAELVAAADGDEEEADENDREEDSNNDAAPSTAAVTSRVIVDTAYHYSNPESIFYSHPNIESGEKFAIMNVTKKKSMRKVKLRLPRFFIPKITEEEIDTVEDYYRRFVLMFIPWRDEEKILEDYNAKSYTSLWTSHMERLKTRVPEAHADLRKLLDGYKLLQKDEAEMAVRIEEAKAARAALEIDEEEDEQIEVQRRVVDAETHETNKGKMNSTQKEIFQLIVQRICDQEAAKEDQSLSMPAALQLYIAGNAGTGKSFLINLLADELTQKYMPKEGTGLKPAVIIVAPTGIAALAIKGNTIHCLFKIGVQQPDEKGEQQFPTISDADIDKMKMLFSNVKLIIIDEISMVSNVTLMKIHRRCREIKHAPLPFGGFNVVLFGDLLQLAPVKGQHPFKDIPPYLVKSIFGSIPVNINLWKGCEYQELTENMRQGDAREMAEMLNRIRCGAQTDADIAMLESRRLKRTDEDGVERLEVTMDEIAEDYLNILYDDPTAMTLFATNAEVNDFNNAVVEKIKLSTIVINAIDTEDTNAMDNIRRGRRRNRLRRPYQSHPPKQLRTSRRGTLQTANPGVSDEMKMHGGLPKVLSLAIGARVMLRRNIDLSQRLVNGATGVVMNIQPNRSNPEIIVVRFDAEEPFNFPIPKMEARYRRGQEEIYVRRQFPLVLAYAATIHKAQGMTLKNVIIRSQNIFAAGMFYVAASRVTKLEGLFLAGFDVTKIKVDVEALIECNRLRATKGMAPLEVPKTKKLDAAESGSNSKHQASGSKKKVVKKPVKPTTSQAQKKRLQRVAHQFYTTDRDILDRMPKLNLHEDLGNHRMVENVVIGFIHMLCMMEFVQRGITEWTSNQEEEISIDTFLFEAVRMRIRRELDNVFDIVTHPKILDASDDGIKAILRKLTEESLPKTIVSFFTEHMRVERKCKKCKGQAYSTERCSIIWLNEDKVGDDLAKNIERQFNQWFDYSLDCSECVRKMKCKGKVEEMSKIHSPSLYLIVGQQKGSLNHMKFKPLPQDPIKIGNDRYLLIGAVNFNESKTGFDDDVEVWYKSPEAGWIKSTDNGVTTKQDQPFQNKNIDIYLFVRKDKLRQTEEEKRNENPSVIDDFENLHEESSDDENRTGETAKTKSTIRLRLVPSHLYQSENEILDYVPHIKEHPDLKKHRMSENVVIGFLHMLHMMKLVSKEMVEWIPTNDADNDLDQYLVEVIQSRLRLEVEDVVTLVTNQKLLSAAMKGVKGVMSALITQCIPKQVQSLFAMCMNVQHHCSECDSNVRLQEYSPILWLKNNKTERDLEVTIAKNLKQHFKSNKRCTECGGKVEGVNNMHSSSNYLIVGQESESSKCIKYDSIPGDQLKIGDDQFLLIGAISFKEENSSNYQVVAWYKNPQNSNSWIHTCGNANTPRTEIEIDMKNINIFVFARPATLENSKDGPESMEIDDGDIIATTNEHGIDESYSSSMEVENGEKCTSSMEVENGEKCTSSMEVENGERCTSSMEVENAETTTRKRRSSIVNSIDTQPPKRTWNFFDIAPGPWATKPTSTKPTESDNAIETTIKGNKKPKINTGRNDDAASSNIPKFLLLENASGTECFFNVIVNMLYSCEDVQRRFLARHVRKDDKKSVGNNLARIFQEKSNNSSRCLRECLSDLRLHNGQQNIGAALEDLMNLFENENSLEDLRMVISERDVCTNRDCFYQISNRAQEQCIMYSTWVLGNNVRSFNELVDTFAKPEVGTCTDCHSPILRERKVKSAAKYHFVIIEHPADRGFVYFPPNVPAPLYCDDSMWKLKSLCEYETTDGGATGHYMCWTKADNEWIQISDDHVIERNADFRLNSNRKCSLMMFEHVDHRQQNGDGKMTIATDRTNTFSAPSTNSGQAEKVKVPEKTSSKSKVSSLTSTTTRDERRQDQHIASDNHGVPERHEVDQQKLQTFERHIKQKVGLPLLNENGANVCFLNSALNILYAVPTIRKAIYTRVVPQRTFKVIDYLTRLFNGSEKCADVLQDFLPRKGNGRKKRQGDAAQALEEIWELIIEQFPEAVQNVQVVTVDNFECVNENPKNWNENRQQLEYGRLGLRKSESLENALANVYPTIKREKCNKCGEFSAFRTKKVEGNCPEFHIMLVDKHESTGFLNLNTNEMFQFWGYRWKLCAMSELQLQHYMTLVEQPDRKWTRMNDKQAMENRTLKVFPLAHFMILLFRKI